MQRCTYSTVCLEQSYRLTGDRRPVTGYHDHQGHRHNRNGSRHRRSSPPVQYCSKLQLLKSTQVLPIRVQVITASLAAAEENTTLLDVPFLILQWSTQCSLYTTHRIRHIISPHGLSFATFIHKIPQSDGLATSETSASRRPLLLFIIYHQMYPQPHPSDQLDTKLSQPVSS